LSSDYIWSCCDCSFWRYRQLLLLKNSDINNYYYLLKNSEFTTYLHLSFNNWLGIYYLDVYIILEDGRISFFSSGNNSHEITVGTTRDFRHRTSFRLDSSETHGTVELPLPNALNSECVSISNASMERSISATIVVNVSQIDRSQIYRSVSTILGKLILYCITLIIRDKRTILSEIYFMEFTIINPGKINKDMKVFYKSRL